MTSDSTNFYRNLSTFSDFSELDRDMHYQKVPSDWWLIITDVVGSTGAIEAGKYREVNTVGAAAISVLAQSLGHFEFPFVFGGDGASILIHQADKEMGAAALSGLRALARKQFGLELRVGMISVKELEAAERVVQIAKYAINPHQALAMLKGGGLLWADRQIKENPNRYGLPDDNTVIDELSGLSCRWQPIRSRHGKILTLLCLPITDQPEKTVKILIAEFREVLKVDTSKRCPVEESQVQYKSLAKMLREEQHFHKSYFSFSFLRRFIEILICLWAFKWRLPVFFEAQKYINSLATHSDFRKLDDLLRMVIDCSPTEINDLQKVLQDFYERGEIYYGIHLSNEALMTCLVESLSPGGHIHFIDGADGGYAIAAKGLKQQMAEKD